MTAFPGLVARRCGLLATLALGMFACEASFVTTAERGAEPAAPGGRSGSGTGGGTANVGGSQSAGGGTGQPGASGGYAREPTIVEPADEEPVVYTACYDAFPHGRPHSFGYQASAQHPWAIVASSSTDRAGSLYYASTTVQSYAAPYLEDYLYFSPAAPVGGLQRVDNRKPWNDDGSENVLDDGVVANALVACKGYALRKRTGDHGGSVVERIDLVTKAVERVGPEGTAPDREPGRVDIDGCLDDTRSMFVWSIATGGTDGGIYRMPMGGGPVTHVAAGGNDDFTLLRGAVLRVVPGVLADGRHVQTLESIPLMGGAPQALFTIEAFAMTPPVDIDQRLYFAAIFAQDAPAQLLRAPSSGGTPRLVSKDICPADPWLPSIYGTASNLRHVCPGAAALCTVTPLD